MSIIYLVFDMIVHNHCYTKIPEIKITKYQYLDYREDVKMLKLTHLSSPSQLASFSHRLTQMPKLKPELEIDGHEPAFSTIISIHILKDT